MDVIIYIALLTVGLAFGIIGWFFAKHLRLAFFTLSSIILITLSIFKEVTYDKVVKSQEIVVNSSVINYTYTTLTIHKNIEPFNWIVMFLGILFLMGLMAEAYFGVRRRWGEIYE